MTSERRQTRRPLPQQQRQLLYDGLVGLNSEGELVNSLSAL